MYSPGFFFVFAPTRKFYLLLSIMFSNFKTSLLLEGVVYNQHIP